MFQKLLLRSAHVAVLACTEVTREILVSSQEQPEPHKVLILKHLCGKKIKNKIKYKHLN